MAGPEGIAARIRGILHYVSEAGVSRDQQQTVCRWRGPFTTVSFPGAEHISAALKNRDYRQIRARGDWPTLGRLGARAPARGTVRFGKQAASRVVTLRYPPVRCILST